MKGQQYDEATHLNVQSLKQNKIEYDIKEAIILNIIIEKIIYKLHNNKDYQENFVETYNLKQGIEKFGNQGIQSAKAEVGQLH